jgi:ABC-2 type transport system ATP-binding protein
VSQTCDRVVIINKGRVVAEDTPLNLTRRLSGEETIFVQVDAAQSADASRVLAAVPGVVRVAASEGASGAFEVESEKGRDVRHELAKAVVLGGYDLLELRPLRVSLEEIFLSLITEEKAGEAEA